MKQKCKAPARVLLSAVLLFYGFVFLFPILVTVTNSFMSEFEIVTRYTYQLTPSTFYNMTGKLHFVDMELIPYGATVQQYIRLLFDQPLYLGLFWNSIQITLPIVIGQLLITGPAAYAFEFGKMKHRETLFLLYIVVMFMPLQVVLVPNFMVVSYLNLNGTLWAIWLPAIFNPFGVFLSRQFLKAMPYEYIEAAKIDGAGNFSIYARIIIPLIRPALATLAILVFVEYWNVVEQAVIFIKESYNEPLSVYLSRLAQGDYGFVFAASCFYMLPTVLIFLLGQEYMVEGIQLSGIK